jgi:hypothetical protein
MTESRQEKPKNLIPKPVSQAVLAGASASSLAYVFGVPLEYAPRIALAGAGFSLYLSWQDSRHTTKPKKRNKGQAIPFSSVHGTREIYRDLEYSMSQGGILTTESYIQALGRKLLGDPRHRQMSPVTSMERPVLLDEFIFHSHYRGQIIQLRERHVKLFLKHAWRNRANGKGISWRYWDRNRSQRPAWYKELPNIWFPAMLMLIWNTQKYLNRQLVITLDNQQSFLAVEPFELFIYLKWYECEKGKSQ